MAAGQPEAAREHLAADRPVCFALGCSAGIVSEGGGKSKVRHYKFGGAGSDYN